ncbi:hypothetical protein BFF78_20875 [Streptomyces fodineus]|uniref:Alpha/beta hydrolase n=1 Tax=Streptomyces fodineus TaxID=1904616 RepID=A0A1D7YCB9_9ACTN|nr:hypothetical protein BFF78_20875 [Streptomyces fodineus]
MAPHTHTDRPLPKHEGAERRRLDVGGTRLHLAEYGGSGTPLLMLHGFPQAELRQALVPQFAQAAEPC